jgi:hypothetical protein
MSISRELRLRALAAPFLKNLRSGKEQFNPPNTLNDANGADLIMMPASPSDWKSVLVHRPAPVRFL